VTYDPDLDPHLLEEDFFMDFENISDMTTIWHCNEECCTVADEDPDRFNDIHAYSFQVMPTDPVFYLYQDANYPEEEIFFVMFPCPYCVLSNNYSYTATGEIIMHPPGMPNIGGMNMTNETTMNVEISDTMAHIFGNLGDIITRENVKRK